MRVSRWFVVMVLLLAASPALADRPVCIIGRSDCRTIVLAEVSWGRVDSYQDMPDATRHHNHLLGDLELGMLVNVAARHGVGLSVGGASDPYRTDIHLIMRGRYRFWLDRRMGLEGSLAYGPANGVQGQVAAELLDQVGLFVSVGREHVPASSDATNVMFGVRFANLTALPALFIGYAAALATSD